jgi:hypothetical protein
MAITLRNDKGSALTYQELDDNFKALTGEPNVRWIHLTKTNSEFFNGGNEYKLIWDSVIHDDPNYFSFTPGENIISVLRPGVYEIISNVVLDNSQDSTYSDGYCTINLTKNDGELEYTTSVITNPATANQPFNSAKIHTIIDLVEDLSTADKLSVRLYNSPTSAGQQIVPAQSDILIRWLGLKPSF